MQRKEKVGAPDLVHPVVPGPVPVLAAQEDGLQGMYLNLSNMLILKVVCLRRIGYFSRY